jgi:hypothetical protein
MGLMLFNVQLSVEVKEDELEATLLFINNTSTKLYLDGMTLCWDNSIKRNMFTITDQKSKEVDYIEAIRNRVIRSEDFVQIEAGEQFKSCVNINKAYNVKKGKRYSIQYSTYNPSSYDPNDDVLIKMESNKVEIDYR